MMDNEIKVFTAYKWMKEINKLRNSLKKKGLKVKITNPKNKNEQVISIIDNDFFYEDGLEIQLLYKSSSVYIKEVYGMHDKHLATYHEEIFESLKQACKNIGANMLIAAFKYGNYDKVIPYGFVRADSFPGVNYPYSVIGNFSDIDITKHEQISYIELADSYLKQRMDIVDRFKEVVEKIINIDKLFEDIKMYYNNSFVACEFYYEGFVGRVLVHYSNPILVELRDDDWFNPTIYHQNNLSSLQNMEECFLEIINIIKAKTSLKNLFNPPKKHFESYFRNNFSFSGEVIGKVFDMLQTEMDYREIEQSIKEQTEKNNSFTEFENVKFFSVFEKYFIFDFTNNEGVMFDKYQDALDMFSEKSYEIEKKRHNNVLSTIELKVKHIENIGIQKNKKES